MNGDLLFAVAGKQAVQGLAHGRRQVGEAVSAVHSTPVGLCSDRRIDLLRVEALSQKAAQVGHQLSLVMGQVDFAVWRLARLMAALSIAFRSANPLFRLGRRFATPEMSFKSARRVRFFAHHHFR